VENLGLCQKEKSNEQMCKKVIMVKELGMEKWNKVYVSKW